MSGPQMVAPRIAIIGGGLAGMAAAVALSDAGCSIQLYESRRALGGRAASFRDPASGELIDHCQHVSMGCCTNLSDFCARTGLSADFRRDRVLHFFDADGRRSDLQAAGWLPAPFHLAPSLLRLSYLNALEKFWIAVALLRLARQSCDDLPGQPTIGQWLRQQRQTPRAVERFWSPVLVSALGETVERASLPAARKVFVDAFLAHRQAYEVLVPTKPLSDLFGRQMELWFAAHRVQLELSTPIQQIREIELGAAKPAFALQTAAGTTQPLDGVILAVPWRRVGELLSESLLGQCPELARLSQIEAAPISGLHLWFDRPITALPHAVMVGTLAQWLFNRSDGLAAGESQAGGGFYYQVVISASRELAGVDRVELVERVCRELSAVFPAGREARLLNFRLVTEAAAVFSVTPGLEAIRPRQQSHVAGLYLAGDFTVTGWPATMEGAVRSGYLAAEALLSDLGQPKAVVCDDLPRNALVRWLVGNSKNSK